MLGILCNSCSKLRFLQGIFSRSIWQSSNCVWQHLPYSTALQLHLTLGSHPHFPPACLLRKMFPQQRWRRECSEGKPELYFLMSVNHEPTKCLHPSLTPIYPKIFAFNWYLLRQLFVFQDSKHSKANSKCLFFYTFTYLVLFKFSSSMKRQITIHKFYWHFFF